MRNYFVLAALALVIPASAHGAFLPAGTTFCSAGRCDSVQSSDRSASITTTQFCQGNGHVCPAGNTPPGGGAGSYVQYRYERYHPNRSDHPYLDYTVEQFEPFPVAPATITNVYFIDDPVHNSVQCPTGMNADTGQPTGPAGPGVYESGELLKACGVASVCYLAANYAMPAPAGYCRLDGTRAPDAAKPAAAPPVAESTQTCAPLTLKKTKIVVKQVGGACGEARNAMSRYVRTKIEPASYVCVQIASKHQVVARCKSTDKHRSKHASLMTATYRR